MSIYTDHGYENRTDYLTQLADDHGVSLDAVFAIAELLGECEDFDGLVCAVQDMSEDF